MNKNNAAEFIPLVQALSEGKTIQFKLTTDDKWVESLNPSFDSFLPRNYRIKPEPIELEGITQATSRCHNDDSGMIRLTVNWPSAPPKIGTKFRLIEIL